MDEDKLTMVAAAVGAQLHHEGHWPPNDLTKVMQDDYGYQQITMSNFLVAIQWNLQHGTPSHAFAFDLAFTIAALSSTVTALISQINDATT